MFYGCFDTAGECLDNGECLSSIGASSSGTGGTGGGGGSGGSGGSSSGTGGGLECTSPDQCGTDTTCLTMTCNNGVCGTHNTAIDTPCIEEGGQVCDGAGNCVECNTTAHCGQNEVCDQHACVNEDCINGQMDNNETDVDCGGSDCNPCPNGDDCLIFSDCESQFCETVGPDNICAPCGNDSDCSDAVDTWCDGSNNGGTCVDKKDDGQPCGGANECLSDHCPGNDGVCCDLACTAECQACLQTKTGTADGTCDDVTADTDPDNECPDASCAGGTFTPESLCNGSGSCISPASNNCAPYTCNATGCLTTCINQNHCVNGYYCNSGNNSCEVEKSNGDSCSGSFECTSGNCVDGVCCDALCNGNCESCLASSTGGVDGVCSPVTAGTDPDNECPGNCDGSGNCV